jgi:hypothetical protein
VNLLQLILDTQSSTRYDQVVAVQERLIVYYRKLINDFLPHQWKALHETSTMNWEDEEWVAGYRSAVEEAAKTALAHIESNKEGFELPSFSNDLYTSTMTRFLTLTTSDTAHPWLARILMDSRGLLEGNMHRPDLRRISNRVEFEDDKAKRNGSYQQRVVPKRSR